LGIRNASDPLHMGYAADIRQYGLRPGHSPLTYLMVQPNILAE